MQSSLGSDLRATAPDFIPRAQTESDSGYNESAVITRIDAPTDVLGSKAFELDMYGIPWFYYMNQVQFAYQQGFHNGRMRPPKKSHRKKNRSPAMSPAGAHPFTDDTTVGIAGESNQQRVSDMPPPTSTLPLAEQRSRQERKDSVSGRHTPSTTKQDNAPSEEDRSYSPFAAQKALITQQNALRNTTNIPRAPNVDLTSIRNVALPSGPGIMPVQNGYNTTLPYREHPNSRRNYNRSDNGLYSYGGRGMVGVPMQNIAFPDPIPPQGRPVGISRSEACGVVDITVAAERAGGDACNACAPDHPLD
ncbi:hypothetical protein EK21DRAFT_67566 [Setomelanomma holmii]|uniref:Uncharacterized protein n=1 Tax=Setomelanomma holmii TaxID=210430 RepID=A0A9P4LL59_9PLEO|nr:hypothetical protein EK21DRAFT_67566 [Setomelanomma holmii]